jgi:hypothetical protein
MSNKTVTSGAPSAFEKPTPAQLAEISVHINEVLDQVSKIPVDERIVSTSDDLLPPKPSYFVHLTKYPRCAFCGEAESLHDANGKNVICSGYLFDPSLSYDPTQYSDKFVGDL